MGYRLYADNRGVPGGVVIVYLSDDDVVGRVERDEEKGIVLRVPEILSEGTLVGEEEALEAIMKADVAVLYGKRIVELAVEKGLVAKDSILWVNGLPHVQVFKFPY